MLKVKRMHYGAMGILLSIILIALAVSSYNYKTTIDLTENLQNYIIPINTTKAENGFEDLMPLKELLKDKKIVAMGESTHGTKEFFEMKHRMFEFLVEEMGYRVFAIEASFGGGQVVNEYINGSGTLEEAIKALGFWTWATEEVADMLLWMRKYNLNPQNESKLKFYGYDMQSIIESHGYLAKYLPVVNVGSPEELNPIVYRELTEDDFLKIYRADKQWMEEYSKTIQLLNASFIKDYNAYIAKSSHEEYQLMLQHSNVILQWLDFKENIKDRKKGSELRDYYMAENVKWILEQEERLGNNNIMLWAHNGHIQKKISFDNMGMHLSKAFGDRYYALGFDFYSGSFRAYPGLGQKRLREFYLEDSTSNSLAYQFSKTDAEISFLDLRSVEDQAMLKLLNSNVSFKYVGAVYFGKYIKPFYTGKMKPMEIFDGIIFIKNTTAALGVSFESFKSQTIANGDDYLASFYRMYLMLAILIVGLVIYFIYKRQKNKKVNDRLQD